MTSQVVPNRRCHCNSFHVIELQLPCCFHNFVQGPSLIFLSVNHCNIPPFLERVPGKEGGGEISSRDIMGYRCHDMRERRLSWSSHNRDTTFIPYKSTGFQWVCKQLKNRLKSQSTEGSAPLELCFLAKTEVGHFVSV
jgi:hypothetical protein